MQGSRKATGSADCKMARTASGWLAQDSERGACGDAGQLFCLGGYRKRMETNSWGRLCEAKFLPRGRRDRNYQF